jgi:hypothetical protein
VEFVFHILANNSYTTGVMCVTPNHRDQEESFVWLCYSVFWSVSSQADFLHIIE